MSKTKLTEKVSKHLFRLLKHNLARAFLEGQRSILGDAFDGSQFRELIKQESEMWGKDAEIIVEKYLAKADQEAVKFLQESAGAPEPEKPKARPRALSDRPSLPMPDPGPLPPGLHSPNPSDFKEVELSEEDHEKIEASLEKLTRVMPVLEEVWASVSAGTPDYFQFGFKDCGFSIFFVPKSPGTFPGEEPEEPEGPWNIG